MCIIIIFDVNCYHCGGDQGLLSGVTWRMTMSHTVATKASSVARSLKSTSVDLGLYVYGTRMGDCQRRPSAVNLCPFVGVDLNL